MNIQTDPLKVKVKEKQFSPRIAIYGIGFVGSRLTRLIVDKGWDIVAAYNRAGEKVGKDLGRLVGLEKELGVIVQDYKTADYSNIDADVALIAGPDFLDQAFPIYEPFLKAGINVISYGSHTYDPYIFHPDIAEKIDGLAKQNGVTFTGSGLWDMTRIWSGLIAAGPCVKIDSFEYQSITDPARQGVHWFPIVGIGLTVEEYNEKMAGEVDGLSSNENSWNGVYKPLGLIILKYYGYTPTGVRMWQEPFTFDEPVYCKVIEKEIPAGICVGTRLRIETESEEGVPVHTTIDLRLFKPGEIEHSTWRVNGLPSMEVRVVREDSDIAQASSALNRIPDVLAARPGIVNIMELGPLRPSVLL
mgnify:CR=1 FL=1|tara:strand:+ start:93 stop:1169 length:1077 start_codon:yes stop_codon:yes gene_type:complete